MERIKDNEFETGINAFGDLDIFSFFRISWPNWIGHVDRLDINRNVS
jgi:hypothetical protein